MRNVIISTQTTVEGSIDPAAIARLGEPGGIPTHNPGLRSLAEEGSWVRSLSENVLIVAHGLWAMGVPFADVRGRPLQLWYDCGTTE